MALITVNPTSNTTPDPGQGGSAVSSATNTGHAATTSTGLNGTGQTKTCIWQSFPASAGQIQSINLKLDWTEDGSFSGADALNQFRIQYSTNGGGAWTNIIDHNQITAPVGPTTATVALNVTQDLTQVRVRDLVLANTLGPGNSASVTGTVANIKIEVLAVDSMPIMMM